jgi:uncharacterized protein
VGLAQNRLARRVLSVLVVMISLYGLVCLVGCAGYRSVLFPAPRDAAPAPPPGASLRELRAADGMAVQAVYFPAPPGARTIVHFHGNGESLRQGVPFGVELQKRGLGVLLVEYRGYGSSKGTPTEEGLYLDAKAALDALMAEGVGPEQVVLSGTSLGTGVAAEMASRGQCERLVLITPYTSIPRLAGRIAPVLPTSWLIRDRFDTLSKVPKIKAKTLVIHGDADEVVPYDMGRDVAVALGAQLITVPGGHHNDLFARRGPELFSAIAELARGGGPPQRSAEGGDR